MQRDAWRPVVFKFQVKQFQDISGKYVAHLNDRAFLDSNIAYLGARDQRFLVSDVQEIMRSDDATQPAYVLVTLVIE